MTAQIINSFKCDPELPGDDNQRKHFVIKAVNLKTCINPNGVQIAKTCLEKLFSSFDETTKW